MTPDRESAPIEAVVSDLIRRIDEAFEWNRKWSHCDPMPLEQLLQESRDFIALRAAAEFDRRNG